jgi:hypothetical protein
MPTDTDRKKIKDQQAGEFRTAAGIVDPTGETNAMHRRTFSRGRPYAANDAAAFTDFAAHPMRKTRAKAIKIDAITAITGNATNYQVFTFSTQYPNGTAGVTLGSWNTHTSAQNTITANVTASVNVVSNSDADIPADMKIVCAMAPQGTGMNVPQAGLLFTYDLEEI